MKKILSIVLAVAMVMSMSVVAWAAYETKVTYTGAGLGSPDAGDDKKPEDKEDDNITVGDKEVTGSGDGYYYVTVPATLAPGGSASVSVVGKWGSAQKVVVNVSSNKVTLTNEGNSSAEGIDLGVTFNNGQALEVNGKDDGSDCTGSATIAIDDFTTAPIFGTWSGTITFSVSSSDVQ